MYESISLSLVSSVAAFVASAVSVTWVSALGQVLFAFMEQSGLVCPALNWWHLVQPACLPRRACLSSVRAGSCFFSAFFVLLVLKVDGGSEVQERMSFFSLQHKVWAAEDASINFCV